VKDRNGSSSPDRREKVLCKEKFLRARKRPWNFEVKK
jgi:hypothetical protein